MKRSTIAKAKMAGKLFVAGAVKQLTDDSTLVTAVTVGLYQGMKYTGNAKRGLIAGAVTAGAISAVNGAATLIKNQEVIKVAGLMAEVEED